MFSLVAGGLLALPPLLVLVVTAPVVAILSIPALAVFLFRKPTACQKVQAETNARHAIITGGSSGIGLCIAQDCVRRGFQRVTILARNPEGLAAAKKALQEMAKKSAVTVEIQALSVDVADPAALTKLAPKIFEKYSDETTRFATYLFCCAGITYPEYFENIPSATFAKIVNTNQLGAIYTVQACLPHMKAGTIQFCSSICGQIGVFGYASYSPTKFALRGFAEVLHMELCNRPIHVQTAYPPDTETPGFAVENLTKPIETGLISEQAGLSQPADVASIMVKEAVADSPRFTVYFTFDEWMLASLTAGFGPVSTLFDAVSQIAGASIFRFVAMFYLVDWWRLVRNHQNKNKTSVAEKESVSTENTSDSKEE